MSRTRIVFYAILAVFLAIIALSLALQVINESFIAQLYIASTVFAAGVLVLDLLGVLGGQHDAGGAGLDHGDLGPAGMDLGGHGGIDHLDTAFDDAGASLDHDGDGDHGDHGDGHASPVLSILAYLRMLVYFCLGFGPTGWVALLTGRSALVSLVLAIPVGVLATLAAQAAFRFQREDTDSTLARRDLQFKNATVLVGLDHATMGKVRVQVGMTVTEQFALAARPDVTFQKGDTVRIVRVSEDCVYVDR